MSTPQDYDRLSRPELLELVKRLLDRVERLEQRLKNAEERASNAEERARQAEGRGREMRERLAQQQRDEKRQATPFAKKKRKKDKKRPGRKPGQGTFVYRQAPLPTEPPVNVPVKRQQCECGGCLVQTRTDIVTITELPEAPKPTVTPYHVQVRTCQECGATTRGKHPDLADDQYGATAHRYGPRALAACHVLHYGIGIPVRKTPQVLQTLTGLEITQGAITQDALRQMKGPVGEVYKQLRQSVRHSDYVHTDDTGWKVGGEPAHLMAFETTGDDPATVYQIRAQHRNEEVRELIPADYPGTMTTDRGKSYDAEELDNVAQNKCVAHLKRNIKSALESQPPGARSFGNELLAVLDASLELWHDFHDDALSLSSYLARGDALREQLTHLLRDRRMDDPDNQRLLNGLGDQDDRGHLLRFLEDPLIEPTNNRAERALRPAVIARKVSQCSKTTDGAQAHAGFLSVLRTLVCRGSSMLPGLTALLRGEPVVALQPAR